MKKLFIGFFSAALMLLCFAPQAKAIITDADDYLIYDSGPLAPVGLGIVPNYADTFRFEDATGVRLIGSERVTFKTKKFAKGRGMTTTEYLTRLGLAGYSADTISGLEIGQYNKPPYYFSALQWKKHRDGCTVEMQAAYRWWKNEDESTYNRPSDSLIIRVPYPCDSVFIETGGSNSGYGVFVYQKDQGFDNGYYMGGNWGQAFYTAAFRPVVTEGLDSFDIVVLPAMKDWFTSDVAWSHQSARSNEQITPATTSYNKGERWGLWSTTVVNRIKIYGQVEPSVIPPFDGTVAGWDFEYLPKASGTVDLETTSGAIDQNTYYSKYASDLGIKRVMMTSTDKGVHVGTDRYIGTSVKLAQLMINEKPETTPDSLTAGAHNVYLDFTGSTEGCRELSFQFDFALRMIGTELTVLGMPADSTTWEILDVSTVADAQGKSLTHCVVPLPSSYDNGNFSIRLIPTGEDYSLQKGVSSLLVANIALKGYNDWYEKDEDAKKIAYISNATDRIHIMDNAETADSLDTFFKELYTGSTYDVTVITQNQLTDMAGISDDLMEDAIKELFADFDLVILSDYVPADAKIAQSVKYLIGYKPFLNLNAAAYAGWNLGLSAAACENDSLALVGADFDMHPLFNDITLTALDGGGLALPVLFSDLAKGPEFLQGVSGTAPANNYFIGKGVTTGANAIVEDYTSDKAKYLFIGVPASQGRNLNSKGKALLDNAVAYMLVNGHYEIPTFTLAEDGAVVENTQQLTEALAYNFSVIGISSPVIYLKEGTYTLGEMKVKNSVTVQPYDNAQVKIEGTFKPVNTATSKLTFKNLAFASANPIDFSGVKQKLSGGLYFEACQFEGLETLFKATAEDSSQVTELSVKDCSFALTGTAPVVEVSGVFHMQTLSLTESSWTGCAAKPFINWSGVFNDSCQVAITVEHNKFIGGADAQSGCFLCFTANAMDTCCVKVDNNIFYKVGATDITLIGTFDGNEGLNNLFEGTTPAWTAALGTVSTLGFADLGMSDPFAASADVTFEKSSPLFRAGYERTYLGPKAMYIDRKQAGTTVVKTVQELKEAIEIAVDGDVIEVADFAKAETDTIDAYVLPVLTYPTNLASFTIRAAEGAEPKIIGNILGAGDITDLTIEGLTWIVDNTLTGYANEANGAAYVNSANIHIYGTLLFRNCSFLKQQKPLFRAKGVEGAYIGKLAYEGCYIEGHGGDVEDGSDGGHLFQLDKAATYTFNNFSFCNNQVFNYHGGQVFNLTRQGAPAAADSIIDYRIANNLFYAFGGAAKSVSKFLEFTEAPAACHVSILIANNLFYERYSESGSPVADIALFKPGKELSSDVKIANNFYYGQYYAATEETLGHNPVSRSDENGNLKQEPDPSTGVITAVYVEQLDVDAMGIEKVFDNTEDLLISRESDLYTAGLNGACIGPESIYFGDPKPSALDDVKSHTLKVVSVNGLVYVQTAEDTTLEVFNLTGQSVAKVALKQGYNELRGMAVGQIYLLKAGETTAKVLVK